MCAGYGGIGLGLKNIFGERLRTIAYCELEGFAQANLISKMEAGLLDAAPIWSDLKAFPYESFHGLVDILIAGYPCQPFSAAGKRAGKDDPRHLWPWIADGIRLLRPRMCFFENVEGHISLGLSTVISDLEELGYTAAWGIFSASEVGAPHQRKRVFILAVSNSLGGAAGLPGSLAGHEGIAGIADHCGDQAWTSRPGEPQHAWEPPRVAGGIMANSNGSKQGEERGDNEEVPKVSSEQWSDQCATLFGGEGEAMGNAEGWRGGMRGNKDSKREGLGSAWTMSSGNMGDSEQLLLSASREHGAMDEASGIPADRKGSESSQADSVAGASRKREGHWADASECSEIKCEMGRDAYGTKLGLGLSELSGLSDSELAEIRQWMVKTDNRTDELRLLGNGVVPATATRAFLTLIQELCPNTSTSQFA